MGPRTDDASVGDLCLATWSPPAGPPAETGVQRDESPQLVATAPAPGLVDLNEPIEPVTPTIRPVDQSALALPTTQVQPGARHEPTSAPLSYLQEPVTPARRAKKQRRPGRALVVLLLLGGLGTAGVVYGPDLYDEHVAEQEPSEPAAPLAFPIVRPGGPDVRTATFEIDGLSTGSTASYTITVDFETWVSRVVIDRPDDQPDLEVLTFADDALVRRLDSEIWFQIDRGSFPFDDQLQRTDWIRAIDDLLPADTRTGIVIDASTEAEVGGVDTRHLVLRLDPSSVSIPEPTPMDPIADIATAAGGEAQASDAQQPTQVLPDAAQPEPVAPPPADVTVAPADSVAPATPVAPADSVAPATPVVPADFVAPATPAADDLTTIEIWVDDRGVIRRSSGAAVLGVRDATILDVSELAWVPDYPDSSQVSPMTAGALLELGL